jgi:hypothetical protein
MSTFLGTVIKIDRKTIASEVKLLNANRVSELYADSTDAIFHYTKNQLDRRERAIEIKVDETKAEVEAAFGGSDEYLSLPLLQKKVGDLPAGTFAKTVDIKVSDISWGWADPDDATKSWIDVYGNTFLRIRYQVNLPIAALAGMVEFWTFDMLATPNAALSADVTGVIDHVAKTVALTVPNGTTVTALIATFTTSTGATVAVSAAAQTSGTTANDFTGAVNYDITGADGKTATYVVTVTIAAP